MKGTDMRAFPTVREEGSWALQEEGMTLRDYFAAKAMSGALASMSDGEDWPTKALVKYVYVVADAMIEERDK